MHLLLTDRLQCPRCGPGFGLILLADTLVERRVIAGALGCPNCRDRFPVRDGFADLRPPPRGALPDDAPPAAPAPDATDRLAALLGVAEGSGHVALLGPLAAHADGLADRVPGIEVVAVAAEARALAERDGVSRLWAAGELPFTPWTFRAVALSGEVERPAELVALVGRGGRIVVASPDAAAAAGLEAARARLLVHQPGWIVAQV